MSTNESKLGLAFGLGLLTPLFMLTLMQFSLFVEGAAMGRDDYGMHQLMAGFLFMILCLMIYLSLKYRKSFAAAKGVLAGLALSMIIHFGLCSMR